MNFSLEGPAGGAQAIGSGIGNAFKAFVMGNQARQRGEQDAQVHQSTIYANTMRGNEARAKYELMGKQLGLQNDTLGTAMLENGIPMDRKDAIQSAIDTGSFGGGYDTPAVDGVGPVMPAPANDDQMGLIRRAMALYNKTNMTGSNVQQMSTAAATDQEVRDRQAIINGGAALPTAQAYFSTSGKAPFDSVGTTGYSVNAMDGSQVEANPVLAKLFAQLQQSSANQHNAAANSSNASAGKYRAETDQTSEETRVLKTTGAKPGAGREASEGALSSTILKTLQIPALNEKGRPVRNPITGEQETTTDLAAQTKFYQWLESEGRKPTATAFSQWEARGRPGPGQNKSPVPAQAAPKMDAQATSAAMAKAREAIAKGAPRDKVIERLRQSGIDTTGL